LFLATNPPPLVISTLSLHDALPIYDVVCRKPRLINRLDNLGNLVSQVHHHPLTYCVASSWKWCCTCSGSDRSVRKKSCRSSGMNPSATHISSSSCGVVISTRVSTSTSSRPTGLLP